MLVFGLGFVCGAIAAVAAPKVAKYAALAYAFLRAKLADLRSGSEGDSKTLPRVGQQIRKAPR